MLYGTVGTKLHQHQIFNTLVCSRNLYSDLQRLGLLTKILLVRLFPDIDGFPLNPYILCSKQVNRTLPTIKPKPIRMGAHAASQTFRDTACLIHGGKST